MLPCHGRKSQAGSFLGPLPCRGPGTRWPLWASECVSDKNWNRSSQTHWSPKQSISGWSHLKERPVVITVSSQYQGQPGLPPDLPSPAPKGPPQEPARASLHLQGITSLRQRNGGRLGRGEVEGTPGPAQRISACMPLAAGSSPLSKATLPLLRAPTCAIDVPHR